MAVIRRKQFGSAKGKDILSVDLIDTPEKLIRFAEFKKIETEPIDIEKVADAFEIQVHYVQMDGDFSGTLYRDEEKNIWVINVNKNHHPNRQRYTIAHELGHFCLHRHMEHLFEDKIFFRGGEISKTEWQANEFASAILMPEKTFRAKVRSDVQDVETLASFFEVSTLALRLRAKNLGMSGHGL